MFVRKNLVQEWDVLRRNSLLKAIALFLLGASMVLLFTSANLILDPNISNSFVYLQKMYLSPSGTMNTATKIILDGVDWVVEAEEINVWKICDKSWYDCFTIDEIKELFHELEELKDDFTSLQSAE